MQLSSMCLLPPLHGLSMVQLSELHLVQGSALETEEVCRPKLHSEQALAFPSLYLLSPWHALRFPPPLQKYPGSQSMQEYWPTKALYLPASHGWQPAEPELDEMVPLEQLVQEEDPAGENLPGSHNVCTLPPSHDRPASQPPTLHRVRTLCAAAGPLSPEMMFAPPAKPPLWHTVQLEAPAGEYLLSCPHSFLTDDPSQ